MRPAAEIQREGDALIARHLPPGKTIADAVANGSVIHDRLLRSSIDEDELIEKLETHCIRLCAGNVAAGKELAIKVIWEGGIIG